MRSWSSGLADQSCPQNSFATAVMREGLVVGVVGVGWVKDGSESSAGGGESEFDLFEDVGFGVGVVLVVVGLGV